MAFLVGIVFVVLGYRWRAARASLAARSSRFAPLSSSSLLASATESDSDVLAKIPCRNAYVARNSAGDIKELPHTAADGDGGRLEKAGEVATSAISQGSEAV